IVTAGNVAGWSSSVPFHYDQADNTPPSPAPRVCWAPTTTQDARMIRLSRSLQRAALLLVLAVASLPALAAPPSDGDINRLLSASRAQAMLDSMLPQIEAMQRQQFEQITRQRQLDPQQQEQLQRIQARTAQT